MIPFFDAGTIGWVLGTVIPGVIAFASYVCRFILNVKQKGWRNISEGEWREFGSNIEREFSQITGSFESCSYNCEKCNFKCKELEEKVKELTVQLAQAKQRLMDHANGQVEKHSLPVEKEGFFSRNKSN